MRHHMCYSLILIEKKNKTKNDKFVSERLNKNLKSCSNNGWWWAAKIVFSKPEMTALGLAAMWKSHVAKRLTLT